MFNAPLPPNTPSPPRTPLREGSTPSSLRAEPTPPLERRAHEQRHEPFEPSPVAGRRRSSVARFFQSMRSPIEASHAAPAAPVLWSNEPTRLAQPAGEPRPWQRLRRSLRRNAPAPYRPVPDAPLAARTPREPRYSDVVRTLDAANPFGPKGREILSREDEPPLESYRLGRAIGPQGRRAVTAVDNFLTKLVAPTEASRMRNDADSASARMRLREEYKRSSASDARR